MTWDVGTRIGQYELTGQVGAGGMGIVFRAHDTRLDRQVAIKSLADGYCETSFRERFERESQAISGLNHPHILTVLDSGVHDGTPYLVTEFVEGGTLRDWLAAPHRQWRPIVSLLVGVADGLAAAHHAMILHRDLKPENILIGASGYAKLADFGLAKQFTTPESDTDPRTTPTVALTHPGAVVGTIAYMSPEQTAGDTVDARSDIFAFGVLLHESLTGEHPFRASSDLEQLAAIREREPSAVPSNIPLPVQWIIAKALEKDPAERYQSMDDVVVDLRRALREGETTITTAQPASQPSKPLLPWAIVAIMTLVALLGWSSREQADPDSAAAERWTTPDLFSGARITNVTGFPGDEYAADISPDGNHVVFIANRGERFEAWLSATSGRGGFRNLTEGLDGDLLAAEGPRPIGFTKDGSEVWIHRNFFVPERVIRVLAVSTTGAGEPRSLFEDHAGADPSWSKAGQMTYYDPKDGDPLYITDPGGLNPRLLLPSPEAGVHQHNPDFSIDGEWVYFTRGVPAAGEMDLWRVRTSGGDAERLPTGVPWLYFPTPIDERTVLFVGRDPDGNGPWLWAYDIESGETRRILVGLETYLSVAASADGRKIVLTRSEPTALLWSIPLTESGAPIGEAAAEKVAIANHEVQGEPPASAPRFRGEDMYFLSSLGSRADLRRRSASGSLLEVIRGEDHQIDGAPEVSPKGRTVVVCVRRGNRRVLLRVGRIGAIAQTLCPDLDPRSAGSWDPTGKQLVVDAALVAEDGQTTDVGLYVIDVEQETYRHIVSGLAARPAWSPSGDRIIYSGPMSEGVFPLHSVSPTGDPQPAAGLEEAVGFGSAYRFHPDGTLIVLDKPPSAIAGDFWHVDLETGRKRRLSELSQVEEIRAFDITPDGKSIVFDRIRKNADIVLIELPSELETTTTD